MTNPIQGPERLGGGLRGSATFWLAFSLAVGGSDAFAPSLNGARDGDPSPERPEISVPAPGGTNRICVGAALRPSEAAPGQTVAVFVKVRIASGHWIYGLDKAGAGSEPTSITLQGEDGPFELTRRWSAPEPKQKSGSPVYAGEVTFEGRARVGTGAREGRQKLPLAFKYQICNEALCWPPRAILLEPTLNVVRSK